MHSKINNIITLSFSNQMKTISNSIKYFILALSSVCLVSCGTTTPYEIKSPCVSRDSENPFERAPCQRRPANIKWDIT